ncbi:MULTISPECIES: lipopolysaccharide biosynthesis protein [unclassified Streptomyces]|uniref:lipopolysaccharide biosynthesis protein n=1 Tax=unclassified Streptomyces TaxID=2593676 RepID=UPI00363E7E26
MTDSPHRRVGPAGPTARVKRLPLWSLIAAGVLLGGAAGGAYGAVKTPQYSATSYVIAVPDEKSDPSAALGFAQAYGRVATQIAVLGDAQARAKVPVQKLQSSVQAVTSPDAPMVAVSATSAKPLEAAAMANAVARALTDTANRTQASTRVKLLQFSPAMKPTSPSSASPEVTALVGASAGGLLGGLVMLVRPRRERTESNATVPGPAAAADLQGSV